MHLFRFRLGVIEMFGWEISFVLRANNENSGN